METLRPVVLGRQLFVDLWAIEGFEPIVCESPSDLGGILEFIAKNERAFVIVEDSWFKAIPGTLRKRLMISQKPVWIPFPDLFVETS